MDVRPGRDAPRPWTEGDAVLEAGLATEVGAAEGSPAGRGGIEMAAAGGAMSETISGGKSEASAVGDGDAVAEAEAVLETGAGLSLLPASPCAAASPLATEDGAAAAIGGGSSSPAEAIVVE